VSDVCRGCHVGSLGSLPRVARHARAAHRSAGDAPHADQLTPCDQRSRHPPPADRARARHRRRGDARRPRRRAGRLAGELRRLVRLPGALFRGGASPNAGNVEVESSYDVDDSTIVLRVTNLGRVPTRVRITNAYDNDRARRTLRPGQTFDTRWSLTSTFGWYDLVVESESDPEFLRRLAGHLENGQDSASDPAIGHGGPA